MVTSVWAKRAFCEAMTKSHWRMNSLPPPNASPFTAAITGFPLYQNAWWV